MANDINPAVIKLTQDILAKYVKKPTLSEKLLKKPPFRFLHDVFAVIIRDTGCFMGLYTDDELNSANIKDRDDKMRFLQKMIDVVRICTNVPLTVKTSKIVAGHEPEKTNELLQLMGKIIEGKLNWKPAVDQVLRGKDIKPVTDKSQENAEEKAVKDKENKSNKILTKSKQSSKTLKHDKTKTKVVNKEKTDAPKEKRTKSKKGEENIIKKGKETINPKLIKAGSHSSSKTPSPSKGEDKLSNVSETSVKEIECNHKEEIKIETGIRLSKNPLENDILETAASKQDGEEQGVTALTEPRSTDSASQPVSVRTPEEVLTLSAGEEAFNSRKSSPHLNAAVLTNEDDLKTLSSNAENATPLELKQTTDSGVEQRKIIDLQENKPAKTTNQLKAKSEVRRESTFTREDSKEQSNSQTNAKPIRPRTSLRPPSARPPSARPGAPRRRDRNVEIILQPNDQVKMSGIQVKLETFGDLDDDGENLVIIEPVNATGTAGDGLMSAAVQETGLQSETLEQGHLVQQILETQKELTQQKDDKQQTRQEKDSMSGGTSVKQMAPQNMNNLRGVIQSLTTSVNPLGKLMDFIPEDIDAMQLEFTMWRDTYTQTANQLKREKSLTESATEPMKNQLLQIESSIVEYMEMIDACRVKISQNNDKILKMLITS